jgi:hypothetical protein
MTRILGTVLYLASAVSSSNVLFDAQATQPNQKTVLIKKSTNISLNISLPKNHVPVGEAPWAYLTVNNLSNEEISYPMDRVFVEGEKDNPPTTLRQRQLKHELRPGEVELSSGGFEPSIVPGGSFTRKYDLSLLYDFTKPGKYTVYIEVLDWVATKNDTSVWVRSPAARFEVTPAK